MKLIDKVLASCMGINVLLCTMMSLNSKALYIDNDDSKGYSNGRNGFDTYITSSAYYRNDARTQSSGYTKQYSWNLDNDIKVSYTGIDVSLYAYVNDSSFTDPRAKYSAVASYQYAIGTLNQNTAARGWNYVGKVRLTPLTAVGEKTVALYGVVLEAGSSYGYTTAADGVQVIFS
ncbi:MAG: hypothetical protein NC485_03285 [Ruminococcus flavefaciens]|nr:hypothetical protein [Ruminococcus flavefaciens]MCM1059205.1 hypothetical protein [Eubacterium sp.]